MRTDGLGAAVDATAAAWVRRHLREDITPQHVPLIDQRGAVVSTGVQTARVTRLVHAVGDPVQLNEVLDRALRTKRHVLCEKKSASRLQS